MSQGLVEGNTEIEGNVKTNRFSKGADIICCVIYPIQRMNNLAASFSKKVFLLYKLYNYLTFPRTMKTKF